MMTPARLCTTRLQYHPHDPSLLFPSPPPEMSAEPRVDQPPLKSIRLITTVRECFALASTLMFYTGKLETAKFQISAQLREIFEDNDQTFTQKAKRLGKLLTKKANRVVEKTGLKQMFAGPAEVDEEFEQQKRDGRERDRALKKSGTKEFIGRRFEHKTKDMQKSPLGQKHIPKNRAEGMTLATGPSMSSFTALGSRTDLDASATSGSAA